MIINLEPTSTSYITLKTTQKIQTKENPSKATEAEEAEADPVAMAGAGAIPSSKAEAAI